MEEDEVEIKLNDDMECRICGEKQFNLREGFYYCEECGTKHEQLRAIEVERETEFTEKHIKTQKIQKIKTEKPQLTSWECYNYILRGLVEELLSLGAKEEVKLMALQVWAAYLRSLQVAFFNKKHAELPRLGVRFLKRDAQTLYNHDVEKRKRKRQRKDDATSMTSGDSSAREWRRKKRKLDESSYSVHSQSLVSTEYSKSQTSFNSSSTGTTTHAIQLNFSSTARKCLKKVMPPKHLSKHEKDAQGLLTCHTMRPKVRTIHRTVHKVNTMSIKQVYAILAIALNLVEDNIQMSDLVRFINEGHVTAKNVLKYLPENVIPHCKNLLREIEFYLYPDKYSDKDLRNHVGLLAKTLRIKEFQTPNLYTLVQRYVVDLNLPQDIATYIERQINLLPPQMQTRVPHHYAAFEARAMAYIVFVLKMLFGLDGHKEKLISKSAIHLNKKIAHLNSISCNTHPLLFVWSDWMEYIEMRKIIVAQYNSTFCQQFKQCQSTTQLLEEWTEERTREDEQNNLVVDSAAKNKNSKIENMQRIFENLQQNLRNSSEEQSSAHRISFSPSFTPSHSYFKCIQLQNVNINNESIFTPEFMQADHTQSVMEPFLQTKTLHQFLQTHNITLKISPTACSNKSNYVGIFRTHDDNKVIARNALCAQEADFSITEEKWLSLIINEPLTEELEFKTELDSYEKGYMKRLEAVAHKRRQRENEQPEWLLQSQKELKRRSVNATKSELEMNDKAVKFSEFDMDPIDDINLKLPRRHLDDINLFAHLSDEVDNDAEILTEKNEIDEAIKKCSTSDNDTDNDDNNFTLFTSKMDYWILLGSISILKDNEKKTLESKFPRSFFWLLETCAQIIGVEWSVLYEQLLVIEIMYGYGIEKLDDFRDCVRFIYNNPIKDINMLVNSFREIW